MAEAVRREPNEKEEFSLHDPILSGKGAATSQRKNAINTSRVERGIPRFGQ